MDTASGTVNSAQALTLASRARGVFLGVAVGDALGWPQEQNSGIIGGRLGNSTQPVAEFRSWSRYGGSRFHRYIDPVPAGSYSDDTQLTLAVARSLQGENWFHTLTATELPLFLIYQRGAGGATLRACRHWAKGTAPWDTGTSQSSRRSHQQYFAAGGNGVAMRVAPHSIAFATRSRTELVQQVIRDGITTHGHPRALVGAAVFAVAQHFLLNTTGTLEYGELIDALMSDNAWQDPRVSLSALPDSWLKARSRQNSDIEREWIATIDETRLLMTKLQQGLSAGVLGNDLEILGDLGCFNKTVNGSGTISATGAVYLASRNAPRPVSGLVRAAFMEKADTDTMASMTAGLLGALHGSSWLQNGSKLLQDRGYIEKMADNCVSLTTGDRHEANAPRVITKKSLDEFMESLAKNRNIGQMPDGRLVSSSKVRQLESRTEGHVNRWMLAVDGQTLTVDIPEKVKRAGSDRPSSPNAAGIIRRVSLMSRNLEELENFYGVGGLGLHTQNTTSGELLVGNFVRFVKSTSSENPPNSPVLLEIEVENIGNLEKRFKLHHLDRRTAQVQDPSGYNVRLFQGD